MTSQLATVWRNPYTKFMTSTQPRAWTQWVWRAAALVVAAGMSITAWAGNGSGGEPSRSEITSVRAVAGNLVVKVRVPAGQRRVTLETRSQVHRGGWTPRKVQLVDHAESAEETFLLPLGTTMETVRVREETESELGLPLGFFKGTNAFAPQLQSGASGTVSTGTTGVLTPGAANFDTTGKTSSTGSSSGTGVTVVESDIWNVDGRTLYFFNQQRGLQVIDLTNPDHPALVGTLPIAVWGEQLYRLPASGSPSDSSAWVALLTQQDCNGAASEVMLVQVIGGKPVLKAELSVPGQIRESRLVDDTLVVASSEWVDAGPIDIFDDKGNVIGTQPSSWVARTVVSSFDLSTPATPRTLDPIPVAAAADAVMATDQFLFLATTGTRKPLPTERIQPWALAGNHAVIAFDLRQPSHQPVQSGYVLTAGQIADKFRIGFDGTTLATVSHTDSGTWVDLPPDKTGSVSQVWQWTPPNAVLETFSLANPMTPVAQGKLTLVTNEFVYGARFSGSRAYVVTYRQIDPLWIVDLSQPANPAVVSHLSIPGFSSYLQPMADETRLMALGSDGSRTRLQLFDVANAAKPQLMSEVVLGTGWSWTEGMSNEKAFSVFPDLGLALLPWQGQQVNQGKTTWFQGTQLIDFDLARGTLKARGTIESLSQARRATTIGNRILSLSASELTTVDPTNRDLPTVVDRLSLTTQVDTVLQAPNAGQLVLISKFVNGTPQVRLAGMADPEKAVASLDLDPLPVTGATIQGDLLQLYQANSDTWDTVTRPVTRTEITKVLPPAIKLTVTNIVTKVIPPPLIEITSTNVLIREESAIVLGVIRITTNEVPVTELVARPIATNWVWTNWTTEFPPIPGESELQSVTTTWYHPVYTPEADTIVTYPVVETQVIQPPVRYETNQVTSYVTDSVYIPGRAQVATVRVGTNSLKALGSVTVPFGTNDTAYWGPMKALWLSPNVAVWTEQNDGGFNYGGPIYLADFAFKATALTSQRMIPSIFPYYYNQTGHFITVDSTEAARPSVISLLKLDRQVPDGVYWSGSSGSYLADGKIYLSHQTTLSKAPYTTVIVVTNKLGQLEKQQVEQPGVFEIRHFLDVVDFADPAVPVLRQPVPLPGALAGISHGGQMLYTRGPKPGDATDPIQYLQACAYDGTAASLVGSMPLPNAWPSVQWVGAEGTVWIGRPSSASNTPSYLETWSLGTTGKFEFQGSMSLAEPVSDLRLNSGLLLATSNSQALVLDPAQSVTAKPVLVASKPCSIWYSAVDAAVSRTDGLWLPRGNLGLWHIAPAP